MNRQLNMAKQGFVFVLILLAVLPQYLHAQSWTPGLKEAATAVAAGEATYAQKLQVHLHRAEVSKMGLTNTEFQKVSAEAEKAFNLANDRDIKAAADHVGFRTETKPGKGFNPGADTDVNVVPKNPGQKVTLKDIKAMEKYHDDLLRARCKAAGIPYKKPDIDTDYLPHPDHTTDQEFEKIAKYINEEKGGTAYRTRTAARAELKMASGKPLNAKEVGVYAQEMKWQMNRKTAKTNKLYTELTQARKAQDLSAVQKLETEIQLANSQKSKYIQRTKNLNDQARKRYGLEPGRQEIAGADAAIDTLSAAGRGALTAKDAAVVGALSDSAMLKAQEELADTLIEAGKHFPSARQSLPRILNDLPPSSQGNMIARMEQTLGAEATKSIVSDAKILNRVTSAAAQDALNRMQKDLNFGKPAPKAPGGITKLQVAMAVGTAIFMAKTGYDITMNNIEPTDSDFDMWKKMMSNSLYYGSGIGQNYDLAMKEEMARYQREYARGNDISMTEQITVSLLKTGLRGGKDMIFGVMMIPDGIAHLLAWGHDWASGAGAAKAHARAQNALADAMQKVILEKKAFNEAMAMVGKYGLESEDALVFLNCMCSTCGGSLGGNFNPAMKAEFGYGPCQCNGPLSIWKTPIPSGQKKELKCFNNVTALNYQKDRAIFDKWHQRIIDENEKSVAEEIKEIKKGTSEGEFLDAADLLLAIKPLIPRIFRDLSHPVVNGLMAQARANAKDLQMEDPLRQAAKKMSKASEVMPDNEVMKGLAAKYESWEEGWRNFIGKEAPAIEKGLNSGKLVSTPPMLWDVQTRMNQGILPSRHHDPVMENLLQLFKDKSKEYSAVMQKNGYAVRDLERDRNPRGVIGNLEKILQDWEHLPESLKYMNRQLERARQNVLIAERNDEAGDSYREKKNYPAAIDRYQVSLRHQQDATVQAKLDSLLNRHASAGSDNEDERGRGSYDYGEDASNVDPQSIAAGRGAAARLPSSNQVQQNVASAGAAIGPGYREDPIIDAQRERELEEEAAQAASAQDRLSDDHGEAGMKEFHTPPDLDSLHPRDSTPQDGRETAGHDRETVGGGTEDKWYVYCDQGKALVKRGSPGVSNTGYGPYSDRATAESNAITLCIGNNKPGAPAVVTPAPGLPDGSGSDQAIAASPSPVSPPAATPLRPAIPPVVTPRPAKPAAAKKKCPGSGSCSPGAGADTGKVSQFGGRWAGKDDCDASGDAMYRWVVALQQQGDKISGSISFHQCPGGGRVVYVVSGKASSAKSVKLDGRLDIGMGPLGDSATSKQSFTVKKDSPPSPNLAP